MTIMTTLQTLVASVPVLTTAVSPFIAQVLLVAAALTAIAAATLIARTMYRKLFGAAADKAAGVTHGPGRLATFYGAIISPFSSLGCFCRKGSTHESGGSLDVSRESDSAVSNKAEVESVGLCSRFLSFIPCLGGCSSEKSKKRM